MGAELPAHEVIGLDQCHVETSLDQVVHRGQVSNSRACDDDAGFGPWSAIARPSSVE
jgi:hypothetical protein